jgi:glycine/D-amino acid oxidase-like deaminating enzyme
MLQDAGPPAGSIRLQRNEGEEGADLHSGHSVWTIEPRKRFRFHADPVPSKTEVAIIGAGITGAFVADRLAREGRHVAVFDRRTPASGSTAASTALLQWEIDAPMLELADRIGFEGTVAVFRRCHAALAKLKSLAAVFPLVGMNARETLYLAGTSLDAAALAAEEALRIRAELPSRLIGEGELKDRGLVAEAALLSAGSAEVDPVALTLALLARAKTHGAHLVFPVSVTDYHLAESGARLLLDDGSEVEAQAVVLATGYEMPAFVPAARHRVVSTWAIATAPQPVERLWPGRPLVWEASDPYAYLRTTETGRIIVGGEDEPIVDADIRDALLPQKRSLLLQKLANLAPQMEREAEVAWAGFFGETEDGLPLIGPVPGMPRCYAAFGYGGNGITFSAIAATIIARLLRGEDDNVATFFKLDR